MSEQNTRTLANLALWNAVEETPPHHTKSFTRPGGFKGTAVNPTYIQKRATEQFGPKGIGWGVKILEENIIDGHVKDGLQYKIHVLRIELWYKWGGQMGSIVQYGQTTFVGKNSFGPYTDEEAPKKSLTDATSKALASLGFGADIHQGMYDDHKYVESVQQGIELAKIDDAELKDKLIAAAKIGDDELREAWTKLSALEKEAVGGRQTLLDIHEDFKPKRRRRKTAEQKDAD